jgi:hypothetical protein
MSKNLTRKGLALGAVVALGASLLAGAPAFAAGKASTDFTLAANAGDAFTSIAGSTFDLKSTITTGAVVAQYGTATAVNDLSFLVTNADASWLKLGFNGANGTTTTSYAGRTAAAAADIAAATTDTNDTVAQTAKAIVVTGKSGDQGVTTASSLKNHLTITSSADASDNVVVKVVAFIDENRNGLIDSTDLVSPEQTVTFIPAANVTATTTITSAVIGANTISAKVVLGGGINMANLPGGDVKVGFTLGGVKLRVTSVATTSVDTTDASWDSVDALATGDRRVLNSVDAFDVIGSGTYVAQAYYGLVKIGSTSAASSSANGTVTSVDAIDDTKATGTANVKATASNVTKVKTGYTGAITFKTTVKNIAAAAAVKVAGIPVKVTLTKSVLATGSTFTVGTAVLTATSGAVSFATTTAADGTVTFTGSGTGAKDDSVIVSVSALKSSGGYVSATNTNTVTFEDAAVSATGLVNTDLVGASAQLKSVFGSSFTVNYSLRDQFGQPFTGVRRLKVTNVGGTAVFAYYPEFSAGKASQVIVDNSTAAGTIVVNALLQKKDTTGAWVTDSTATVSDVTVNNNAKVTTAVTAVSSAGDTKVATITDVVVAADLRLDANTTNQAAIAYQHSTAAKSTITGTATDVNGAAVAGQLITVSGAGVGFLVNDNVYTVGTATITTGADGAYSVDVFSNIAGAKTITVTAGAATKTATVTFSGVTTLDTKGSITIDVASLTQVGRSVTATITVKDSLGNVVNTGSALVAVSVTGVGSVSSALVDTDADGKATVQFTAGSNDFGDAVLTAKYTNADETVVSATKTVTVGITDAQVDIVKNRVTAVASFSKGKTVAFYVDGVKKWSKLSASDADVVLNYNLKKGAHTITVKVSGGFVTTEKFIVK